MPRQAVHVACGGVAIRNSLRIGPGATRKILAALGGLEIAAKTAARGQGIHIPMRNPLRIGPGRRKILLLADLPFQVGEVLRGHATWRHAILCASVLGTRKIACRPSTLTSSCVQQASRRKTALDHPARRLAKELAGDCRRGRPLEQRRTSGGKAGNSTFATAGDGAGSDTRNLRGVMPNSPPTR